MTGYQAYLLYVALKRHFTDTDYNVIKYSWKVNASHDSYERRRDKHYFNVLAKKPDPKAYLIANFLESSDLWIGDLVNSSEAQDFYFEWEKRNQALTRTFSEDILNLKDLFRDNFDVTDQLPHVLRLYRRGKISHETLVILNNILNLVKRYDVEIQDKIIWPAARLKIVKYSSLMSFDTKKFTRILRDRFTDDDK